MAARRRPKREDGTVQLPLFGEEGAARAAEQIPLPTAASNLRHANTWFGLHLASLRYSPNTIESYTTAVELLARFLGGDFRLEGVGVPQLQRFLVGRASAAGAASAARDAAWLARGEPKAPVKTLALRVTALRKFFQALVDKGVLPRNPADEVYPPGGDIPLPEVLSPAEEERLRALAWAVYRREEKPDARPLFVTMLTLDLGLRRGELETLTRSQVDVSQPSPVVRIHYRERRHRYKNRTLAAPPEFREVYREYLRQYQPTDERVLTASRRTLHRIVERLGARVGAAVAVTPMVMRWTCALRWYNEYPPEETQRLLGLSPIGWQDADRVLHTLQQRDGTNQVSRQSAPRLARDAEDAEKTT